MTPALLIWLVFFQATPPWPIFPWLSAGRNDDLLERRIPPPAGFERVQCGERSFGAWLRALPVKPGRPAVRLFDGSQKLNQAAHFAVLDIDVGGRNLQQCADAIIRLRAEYLRSVGCEASIQFHFTSGDLVPWTRWRTGQRPVFTGNRMAWHARNRPDSSYPAFRRYLDEIFTYAGSASLAREVVITAPARPMPGDLYIRGGSPGHAVLVADVCVNDRGERLVLLIQSYMPAQEIHILVNPGSAQSPWYLARPDGRLITPEWIFDYRDLRRFPPSGCTAETMRPPS